MLLTHLPHPPPEGGAKIHAQDKLEIPQTDAPMTPWHGMKWPSSRPRAASCQFWSPAWLLKPAKILHFSETNRKLHSIRYFFALKQTSLNVQFPPSPYPVLVLSKTPLVSFSPSEFEGSPPPLARVSQNPYLHPLPGCQASLNDLYLFVFLGISFQPQPFGITYAPIHTGFLCS